VVSRSLNHRVIGSILGGALGDAIGSAFEGREPAFEFVVPRQLRISDDTQMTLATCEAIMERTPVLPESIALHFSRWHRSRRITGMGSSTLKALTELDAGGHWALVGASGDQSAGNGAAMRVAPLAFLLNPDNDLDRQTIRDVCRITHRNDEAYIGGLAIIRAIRHALANESLDERVIQALIVSLPDSRVRDRFIEIEDNSLTVQDYATTFACGGYVVDSVPLAVLASVKSQDYMSGIATIMQCGGDTDTIASMYGQIFGAAHGVDALPGDLIWQIDEVDLIEEIASTFARWCVSK
jgi:ADP-ribosyl-[dinitrogen reductase] hydrolase